MGHLFGIAVRRLSPIYTLYIIDCVCVVRELELLFPTHPLICRTITSHLIYNQWQVIECKSLS